MLFTKKMQRKMLILLSAILPAFFVSGIMASRECELKIQVLNNYAVGEYL